MADNHLKGRSVGKSEFLTRDESHPITGMKYRHYEGKIYLVMFLAMNAETKEGLVIYRLADYSEEKIHARSVQSWCGRVEDAPRFTRLYPAGRGYLPSSSSRPANEQVG